jgi:hypothetical protein
LRPPGSTPAFGRKEKALDATFSGLAEARPFRFVSQQTDCTVRPHSKWNFMTRFKVISLEGFIELQYFIASRSGIFSVAKRYLLGRRDSIAKDDLLSEKPGTIPGTAAY